MKARRFLRASAGLVVIALLTAACGLKQGATDALKQNLQNGGNALNAGAAGGAGVPGAAGGAGSNTGAGGIALGGSGGTTGTTTSNTGSASGTNSANSSAVTSNSNVTTGGSSGSGPCAVPTGGNSTGITAKVINIGLHAPLTGTGTPFPNTAFQQGANTYWEQKGHQVCGRQVKVDFQDDTYTPSGAHQVCEAMAQRDFFVVGGGGTDQIQACATDHVIDSTGTPYLSAGVTDNGMRSLPNYFATSLTYQAQGPLVLQMAENHGYAKPAAATTGKQWAIVTANTPNFEGARKGIEDALTAAGISYEDIQVNQNGNYQADAGQLGQKLALEKYRVIYVDLAPGYYVFMAGGFYGSGGPSDAKWVSPGVTFTEMTAAQYLCESSHNAISGQAEVLAPFPGIDHATQDFKTAYAGKYDDIEWVLWGLSEVLYQMLQKSSDNLTRQHFIQTVANSSFTPTVFPPVVYAGKTHFGGTGAYVQQIDCNHTEPDQSSPGTWITMDNGSYMRL